MTIITGREKQQQREEDVKQDKVEEPSTNCYLGIMVSKAGHLKERIKETESKRNRITRDTNGIS